MTGVNDKLSNILMYSLRVILWSFNCFVIWPTAAIVLITAALFWRDNTTPGTEVVRIIHAATIETVPGELSISKCQSSHDGVIKNKPPEINPVCEKKLVKVNALEYASNFDREMWNLIKVLWVTMAVVFGLVASALNTFPSYRSGAYADQTLHSDGSKGA